MQTQYYYMEEGSVKESGSHKELMAMDGKYARMFDVQADSFLGSSEMYV